MVLLILHKLIFEEFSQKIIKVAKYPLFSGKIKILITLLFLQLLKVEEIKVPSEFKISY